MSLSPAAAVRAALACPLLLRERWQSGVAYNPLSPRMAQDPYPVYAALRERDPVHRSRLMNAWMFTRHADVDATLVMAVDPEPHDAQTFWRAAERAGISARLFDSDGRFEGYPWYDALARVRSVTTAITEAGATHPLDALRAGSDPSCDASTAPGLPETLARPDAIAMHLHIVRGDSPPETMTVPADLAFAAEVWSWVAEAQPLVTRGNTLSPRELTQLLRASFFSPSDDAEADSYETQRSRFDADAMHITVKLLATEEEARKHTIAEAVWREILWVMPPDRKVSITVSGGRVSVEFGPQTPAPEGIAA